MPFLGPVAGPLVAKGAISLGGSLLGGKLFGGPSKDEKNILSQMQAASAQGQRMASGLETQGNELMGMARGAYNPVIDYWTKLLSGGSQAASVLAPEYAQIGQGYRAANQAASELMPRGGGRASLMQALPYQQMAQQQGLAQTLRPQAASQLGSLAGNVASSGSNLMSNAVQALYGGTAAGRSALMQMEAQRERGVEMGKQISDIFLNAINSGQIDLSGIFGGKKKSGGGILSSADDIPIRLG